MNIPTVRIARPTPNIARLIPFYRDGLGLDVIGSFEEHDGFDGIMFGRPGAAYHLEFTYHRGYTCVAEPHPDDALVFYVPDRKRWQAAVERMTAVGFNAVSSTNPYWDRLGRTFVDPDGRRIVLQNAAWIS